MRLPLLAVWDVKGGLAVRRSSRSRSDTLIEVLLLAGIFSGVKWLNSLVAVRVLPRPVTVLLLLRCSEPDCLVPALLLPRLSARDLLLLSG